MTPDEAEKLKAERSGLAELNPAPPIHAKFSKFIPGEFETQTEKVGNDNDDDDDDDDDDKEDDGFESAEDENEPRHYWLCDFCNSVQVSNAIYHWLNFLKNQK